MKGDWTVGSAFSGIGGLDLGLEQAGMKTIWQIENNRHCLKVLKEHFPEAKRYGDIRTAVNGRLRSVGVICGGDPCPARSRAKASKESRHPDLSGYLLALAGRCRPRWVLRENVCASDVFWFAFGLESLGYGVTILEIDSADFTCQSRPRQYVIGSPLERTAGFRKAVSIARGVSISTEPSREDEREIAACLTTHYMRLCPTDTFCYEEGRGLRVPSQEEREALHGFPRGWTKSLSLFLSAKLLGNAATVDVAKWIGERMMETDAS